MPLPDRAGESGCGHSNVVRIAASSVALGQPATLSCRAAVSLALWERHVLQPEAIRRFDQRVTTIEHYGSYACRDIAGSRRRSRHATADAFDIAALKLADGTRISVREHWSGDDPRSRFLHALRSGACRWFDGVLSPDYNAAHHDHLHVERGGGRICR